MLTDPISPKLPLRVLSKAASGSPNLARNGAAPVTGCPGVRQAILYGGRQFLNTPGVDWVAALRAAYTNTVGGPRSGAGTIPMQVARNFFLTRSVQIVARYLRKANEVVLITKLSAG